MKQRLFLLLLSLAFIIQAADPKISTADAPKSDWKASTILPGDVLMINVFRDTEFSRSVTIEEDGTFVYPLLGEISTKGLTPRDVAKILTEKLSTQLPNPQIDVSITTWAPRRVYLLGEVVNGSAIDLPNYGKMTALQAISSAGGFAEGADLNNVSVLRRDKDNPEKINWYHIDVTALISPQAGGDNFRLEPDDTIIVPKAPPVSVSGEVGAQGMFFIDTQRPPMCSEVIIRSGGLKTGSDASKIRILRRKPDGTLAILNASLRQAEDKAYENDQLIYSGDTILVPSSRQIYVQGAVKTPGAIVLEPDKVITASQAITRVGGFLNTAKQSDITLIRDGEMLSINLRKIYDSVEDLERDIPLEDGDILYVRESFF